MFLIGYLPGDTEDFHVISLDHKVATVLAAPNEFVNDEDLTRVNFLSIEKIRRVHSPIGVVGQF